MASTDKEGVSKQEYLHNFQSSKHAVSLCPTVFWDLLELAVYVVSTRFAEQYKVVSRLDLGNHAFDNKTQGLIAVIICSRST